MSYKYNSLQTRKYGIAFSTPLGEINYIIFCLLLLDHKYENKNLFIIKKSQLSTDSHINQYKLPQHAHHSL